MRWKYSSPRRRARGLASQAALVVPRLEALESRVCPSSTGPFVLSFRHTMVVRGDSGNDSVHVSAGSGGAVSVQDTSSTGSNASASASGVRHVLVLSGAGNNTVQYGQTGPLTARLGLFVYLGGSTSSGGTVTVHAGGSTGNGHLSANVIGSAGPDSVQLTNSGSASSTLAVKLLVAGGPGNDSVPVDLSGDGGGTFRLNLFGGAGNDSFTINEAMTGALNSGIRISGNAGNDTTSLNFASPSIADFTGLSIHGGDGNDNITLNLTKAIPVHFDALLALGPGNDTLTTSLAADTAGPKAATLLAVFSGPGNKDITATVEGEQNRLLGETYVLGKGNDTLNSTVDLASTPANSAGGEAIFARGGSDQLSFTLAGELMRTFGFTIHPRKSSVKATETLDLTSTATPQTLFGVSFVGARGDNQNSFVLLGQSPDVIGLLDTGGTGNDTFTTVLAPQGKPAGGIGQLIISGAGNVQSTTTFTGDVKRGLAFGFYGGPGYDNLSTDVTLPPDTQATVLAQLQGGVGQDTFGVTVNAGSNTDVVSFFSGSTTTTTLRLSPNVQLVQSSSSLTSAVTFFTDSFAVLLGIPIVVPASSAAGAFAGTVFEPLSVLPVVLSVVGPALVTVTGTGQTFFVPVFNLVATESGGSFLTPLAGGMASPSILAGPAAILTPLNSGQAFLTVLASDLVPVAGGLQGGNLVEGIIATTSSTGGQSGGLAADESLGASASRIESAPLIPFEEVRSAQELLGDVLLGPENLPGRGIAPPVLPSTGGQHLPGMDATPSWIEFPIGIDPSLHRLPPAPPPPAQPGAVHSLLPRDNGLAADPLPSLVPPRPSSSPPHSWRHLAALALGTATAWLAGTAPPGIRRMSARRDGERSRGRGRVSPCEVHGSE